MYSMTDFLEARIEKELSSGEFKHAHTHTLRRRYAEYYTTQKRKWSTVPGLSIGYNPIERFKDIISLFSISLYPEYVVIGPLEKEGVTHTYTEVIISVINHINRNLIHPYLLELLDRGSYPFYDNHIVVDVIDHRGNETTNKRVLLKGVFNEFPFTPSLLAATKAGDKEEAVILAKTANICLDPSPEVFEILKIHEYNIKKMDNVKVEPPQRRKIEIGGIISEYKRKKEMQKREVYPGLERLTSTHIYRTTKFFGGSFHYSINAIANADYIEVIFRQGEVINTAINGFIARRKFFSPAQIDTYIESTKKLLEIYHEDLKCICDISAAPRKIKPFIYSPQQRPEEAQRRGMKKIVSPPKRAHHGGYTREVQHPQQRAWNERQDDLEDFNFDYIKKKFI